MYDSISAVERDTAAKLETHDVEAALRLIISFVAGIIRDPKSVGVVFGSPELDYLCQRIGEKVLHDNFPGVFNIIAARNNLHVVIATELSKSGGHTRVIEDIIAAQPGQDFLVCITDVSDSVKREEVKELFAGPNVQMAFAPSGSATDKLRWLQEKLIESAPRRVFLFNHHHDAIAIAAVQPNLGFETVFYHHADHQLCLGVHLANALHVDPHNLGFFNCRENLGIAANAYWPLTVPDLGVRPRPPSFLTDGKLRTCSSGSGGKFAHPYAYSYVEEVPKWLDISGGIHIHIGDLPESVLSRIRDGLAKRGIKADRFIHIPWIKRLWRGLIEHRVDLYINSFPLGGGRATIEAMGSGTPLAMHNNYLSRFHGGADMAYPQAFCWKTPNELCSYLTSLTPAELAAQSEFARRHYERHHRPDMLAACLADISGQHTDLAPMPLRTHGPKSIDALDAFLHGTTTDITELMTILEPLLGRELLNIVRSKAMQRSEFLELLLIELTKKAGELRENEVRLNDLYSSTFWRLSAPLRYIRRRILSLVRS